MSIFHILEDIIEMPVRVVLDAVQLPGKIVLGEDGLLENTVNGIENIKQDLNERKA